MRRQLFATRLVPVLLLLALTCSDLWSQSSRFKPLVFPSSGINLSNEDIASLVEMSNLWLLAYADASASLQKLFRPAAQFVAEQRRILLKQLIELDPERALGVSLSPDQRRKFPEFILQALEKYVDDVGNYEIEYLCDLHAGDPQRQQELLFNAGGSDILSQRAIVGGKRFIAQVYGRRKAQSSKHDIPIHGIAVGDLIALREDPLRVLDPGEVFERKIQVPQGMNIVAISGRTIYFLPDRAALPKLIDQLTAVELCLGPDLCPSKPPAIPAWTHGTKRILVIRVDFADMAGPPVNDDGQVVDEAWVAMRMEEASGFFAQNSYGQTNLTHTLVPQVLRMSRSASDYATPYVYTDPRTGIRYLSPSVISPIRDEARDIAAGYDREHGGSGLYDPTRYDRFIVVFSVPPGFAPRTYSNGSTLRGNKNIGIMGIFTFHGLTHEIGHSYGFSHAGREDDVETFRYEQGDPWDRMGIGTSPNSHYNAVFKQSVGWLKGCYYADSTCSPDPAGDGWVDVAARGTFRLYPHDTTIKELLHTIRIDTSGGYTYWVDSRGRFPESVDLISGVEVHRQIKPRPGSGTRALYQNVRLLNMHPNPIISDWSDHTLKAGQSFSDTTYGIVITVIRLGISADWGPFADVQVELTPP